MENRGTSDNNDTDDSLPVFNFGNPTGGAPAGAAPAAAPGAGGPNPFAFLFPSLFGGNAPASATAPASPPAGRGGSGARGRGGGGRGGGRGGGGPPPFVLDPSTIPANSPLSFLLGGGAGNAPPFDLDDDDDDDDDDGSPVSYAAIKEERRRNKGKEKEQDRAYILSLFAPSQPLKIEPSDSKTVLELKQELSAGLNYRKIPVDNMGLYFHGQHLENEKRIADYLYDDTKKNMRSCPANVILRFEIHDSMDHDEALTLNSLPPEILISVFRFLPLKALVQLSFVNKRMRSLATSDSLWKPLYGILWSLQDYMKLVDQEAPPSSEFQPDDKEKEKEKASQQFGTDDVCFSCYGLISDQKAGKKIEKIYLRDGLSWKERFKQREDMLKEQSMEEVQRRAAVNAHMKPLVIDEAKGTTKPLNISVIKSCATGSISFGAPAFNRGDEMACFRFYYNTQRNLVHQLKTLDPTLQSYSAATLKGLGYLEEALRMCKMDKKRWSHRKMNGEFREEEESPARHAWRLRFAFDRATNLWKIMETNFSALRSIASEYFRRFQLEEAAAALDEAQALLDEICYEVPTGSTERRSDNYIDRYIIYFDLANLRFALGEFDEAIKNLKIGYDFLPNNTEDFSFDLSVFKRRSEGGCWEVILAWFKELEKSIEQERNPAKKKDLELLHDWIKPTLRVAAPGGGPASFSFGK